MDRKRASERVSGEASQVQVKERERQIYSQHEVPESLVFVFILMAFGECQCGIYMPSGYWREGGEEGGSLMFGSSRVESDWRWI